MNVLLQFSTPYICEQVYLSIADEIQSAKFIPELRAH